MNFPTRPAHHHDLPSRALPSIRRVDTLAPLRLAALCALVLAAACGGPDVGEDEEAASQAASSQAPFPIACVDGLLDEHKTLLSQRTDNETVTAQRAAYATSNRAGLACLEGQHLFQSCFDPVLGRHNESYFCVVKRPDGGLRMTNPRAEFRFFTTAQAGANPNPLYRCVRDGRDMVTRSATCGTLNVAPVAQLGHSYPAGTPGASEVFRCRRAVAGGDIFLSRDPACEGHVREASFGFAL